MNGLPVRQFLAELGRELPLTVAAAETHLDNLITENRVQKVGLALTGFLEDIHPGRVQVFGSNEIRYLRGLPPEAQRSCLELATTVYMPVIIVSRGLVPPETLSSVCRQRGIPLAATDTASLPLIERINQTLELLLAPQTTIHGVLVEVNGVGVLLLGKSGMGKSECALDLLMRGNRLVADDVVTIRKIPPAVIWGSAEEQSCCYMEVRGLGIINIKDLFGIAAVRRRKRIELVVELVEHDDEGVCDRLGVEDRRYPILEVPLPYVAIPVSHGRNLASIVEVAARNHLLRAEGVQSAARFNLAQLHAMTRQGPAADVKQGPDTLLEVE